MSAIIFKFKKNDFVECIGYKFTKYKQIIIFANGLEPFLNWNNLIGSKIEGAYIQRFSAKYDPGSIKNIFEIRSLKKLDRISKNVKYLPPKVRQKINYINKL